MMNPTPEAWDQWGRHVLAEMERHSASLGRLENDLNKMQNTVAALQVKAGIWGAIAGLIPAAIAVLYFIFSERR